MPKKIDPFDNLAYVRTFPDAALRDIGRNESCSREYRKLAVEVLLNRKSSYANHTDLREFVEEIGIELEGIQTEYPAPQPIVETSTGPLTASVTTASLYGIDVVENKGTSLEVHDTNITSEESNLTIPDDKPAKKDADAT